MAMGRIGWWVVLGALGIGIWACEDEVRTHDDDDDGSHGSWGCVSLCEDAKKCDGSDPTMDCGQACQDAEQSAEQAGCKDEFDDYMDCLDGLFDICNSDDIMECAELMQC